ncbi:MAG: D-hexose-6-phosphate mutarotase [Phycisphaeraceae bacterium]|nr:D-hexose-6-phosphate mutarotase [Phycisphaeraceae bacterium]
MPKSTDTILPEHLAIDGRIETAPPLGGLPRLRLQSPGGVATLTTHGAHVLSYQPSDGEPVLWLSEASRLEPGEPIRGGIPVCWPWFADETDDPDRPMHGLARTAMWRMVATEADAETTVVRLRLTDSPATHKHWPHAFAFELTVNLSDHLSVRLTHRNRDTKAVRCTGALHSYFAVDRIDRVRIAGLEKVTYLDKLDSRREKTHSGPLTIDGPTDRIYQNPPPSCLLHDGANRTLQIESEGSRTTVVWNPWEQKARAMPDFEASGYRRMVCVETACCADDVVALPPDAEHTLATTLTCLGP